MSSAEIVFTDRYGGRAPSWLRGCHGPCEAMGVYPSFVPEEGEDPRDIEAKGDWHFIPCEVCDGSGRVSWLRTIVRLPHWLVKGLQFLWDTRHSGFSLRDRLCAAFVEDLRRLRW